MIVTKSIQRQPLTLDNYKWDISRGGDTEWTASCFVEDITSTVPLVLEITQNEQSMTLREFTSDGDLLCTAVGTYSQAGRNGQFQATVACVTGDVGTIVLSEMNIHVGQFAVSRVENTNGTYPATGRGRIAGVIPN